MTSTLRAVGFVTLLCLVPSVHAESKPVEMRWNELASLIGGQRVEAVLNSGLKVKGEVIAVRADELLLDSKTNSNIPRTSLVQINLERLRGAWGRSLGTVLGILTGMSVGGYAALHTDSAKAALPTFLGISGAIGTGGYFVGRQIDRRITKIRIVAP
jgi:hypothetical protein